MMNLIEHAIIGKLIMTLIDEDFRVEISNQDGGGLFVYVAPENGNMPKEGWHHWVRLVPGNNLDVIVDYTTNLEEVLKPVNEWVQKLVELEKE